MLFVLEATGHHRALRGVEAADGAAGYRHEHHREDGIRLRVGLVVGELMPQLRHRVGVYEQHRHDSHGHEEQREAEHGVQLADELVDGQKRGSHVVDEDEDDPEEARHAVGGYLGQQVGRVIDEHGSYEYHQQQGEDAHGELDTSTELAAHDLWQRGSAHAQRHHARHEVVDGSGEDGAENYPQERRRSVHDAHDGAEDGPQTGNVEKLYEENLPGGELDVVYAVGHGLDGRIAGGVYADHLGGKLAVNEIAADQQCQANEKANHLELSFQKHVFSSEAGAKTFTRLFSLTY